MRYSLKWSFFLTFCLLFSAVGLWGQEPEAEEVFITESTVPTEEKFIDGVVEKRLMLENRVLPYEPVREADITWEKRIWREIDIREKINLPFAYPEKPFVTILFDAAKNGEITVFKDENFENPLAPDEVESMLFSMDTTTVINPETYEEEITVTRNDLDPASIKKFRIKEVWYFDKEVSRLKVRILGIAPIRNELDAQGNLKYSYPMFWSYYPQCREYLSKHQAFNSANDTAPMTWYDLFEMRKFSSYITKQSNVRDMRLKDYTDLTKVEQLIESDRIKESLFNWEHDLWSY